jgi:hypothetical protein
VSSRARLSLAGLAITFAAAAVPCQAQQPHREVAGVVTDTALHPVSNATVLVVGTSIRGVTDAMGRYRLCDVQPPNATLKAVFINFRAVVIDSVELRDSVTIVDFRLADYTPIFNPIALTPGAALTNGGGRPRRPLDSAAAAAPVPPPTCRRPGP